MTSKFAITHINFLYGINPPKNKVASFIKETLFLDHIDRDTGIKIINIQKIQYNTLFESNTLPSLISDIITHFNISTKELKELKEQW